MCLLNKQRKKRRERRDSQTQIVTADGLGTAGSTLRVPLRHCWPGLQQKGKAIVGKMPDHFPIFSHVKSVFRMLCHLGTPPLISVVFLNSSLLFPFLKMYFKKKLPITSNMTTSTICHVQKVTRKRNIIKTKHYQILPEALKKKGTMVGIRNRC